MVLMFWIRQRKAYGSYVKQWVCLGLKARCHIGRRGHAIAMGFGHRIGTTRFINRQALLESKMTIPNYLRPTGHWQRR